MNASASIDSASPARVASGSATGPSAVMSSSFLRSWAFDRPPIANGPKPNSISKTSTPSDHTSTLFVYCALPVRRSHSFSTARGGRMRMSSEGGRGCVGRGGEKKSGWRGPGPRGGGASDVRLQRRRDVGTSFLCLVVARAWRHELGCADATDRHVSPAGVDCQAYAAQTSRRAFSADGTAPLLCRFRTSGRWVRPPKREGTSGKKCPQSGAPKSQSCVVPSLRTMQFSGFTSCVRQWCDRAECNLSESDIESCQLAQPQQ